MAAIGCMNQRALECYTGEGLPLDYLVTKIFGGAPALEHPLGVQPCMLLSVKWFQNTPNKNKNQEESFLQNCISSMDGSEKGTERRKR